MQDGIGQTGSGTNDNRVGGMDLQHARQTASESKYVRSRPISQIEVHEALANEANQHKQSKQLRMQHLAEHYKR